MVRIGEKSYKYASDMIEAAIESGYKHTGGYGFACKHCKDHHSARKFTRGKEVVYCCYKCSACWGNMIKPDAEESILETTLICKECAHRSYPNLTASGPHIKATCRKCGAYIKMVGKAEMEALHS